MSKDETPQEGAMPYPLEACFCCDQPVYYDRAIEKYRDRDGGLHSCPRDQQDAPSGGLDAIQFGARVLTKESGLTNEWLFLGWDETHTNLWLTRPWPDEYSARRGPHILCYSQDRIDSFHNVERYGPAVQLPA